MQLVTIKQLISFAPLKSGEWVAATLSAVSICSLSGLVATPAAGAQDANPRQSLSQIGDDLPIPNAIQFPIIFKTAFDSTHATDGDQIKAKLKEDMVINDELIAPAGSLIIGHIERLRHSRRLTESVISKNRRFHKGSSCKIVFDEIITDEDEHLKIVGCLSKQTVSYVEGEQPRNIEIGADGEVKKAEEVFTSEQLVASNVVNFATSTGLNELGAVASMGALPVVMGVIGAANPAIVIPRPMAKDEKHPRVKGFAFGVFSTLPAAPVIGAIVFKGSDLRIRPGDELLAQAHSPYNEPAPVLTISSKILKKESTSTSTSAAQSKPTPTVLTISSKILKKDSTTTSTGASTSTAQSKPN